MRTALTKCGRLAGVAILVLAGVVTALPAEAGGNPAVQVEGVVEPIQGGEVAPGHTHDHAHTAEEPELTYALRLPDATRVGLDPALVKDVPAGTTVRLTTELGRAEAAAIAASTPVDASGTPTDIDSSDLVIARRQPAPDGSGLSRAVLGHAMSTGTRLKAKSITVLAAGVKAYSRGAHQIHAVAVVPRGVNASPASASAVRAQVANASRYWSEQSGGGITFNLTKLGVAYTSQYRCGEDVFSFWNEAARHLGFTEGANKHLLMVFPREAVNAGCAYGLASIGSGPNAGGVALVSDTAWPVLAHEIGHNLGLGHAKVLRSRSADVDLGALPSGSSVVDYGDPFDVMAASATDRAGMLSTLQAANIGILQEPQLATVTSGSRTVRLAPLSSKVGLRGVKVVDPSTGDEYFVEYRTRTGRDARLYRNMAGGVRVLKADPTDYESRGSVVMDATPSTAAGDTAWQIPVGKAFTSRSGRLKITVTGQLTRAATVSITVTPAAGRRVAGSTPAQATPVVKAAAVANTARTDARTVFSWSGAPKGGRYDVEWRQVDNVKNQPAPGRSRTWYRNTTRTSATLSGGQGGVYEVRVRYRVGKTVSPWSAWTTSVVATDTNVRGVRTTGAWTKGRSRAYAYGTFHSTRARNASLTGVPTFTDRIDIVGAKHSRGSIAHVYVDGKLVRKVNTYAARTTSRAVLASIPVTWGKHTVKVVNVPNGKRSQLVLDAIAYHR